MANKKKRPRPAIQAEPEPDLMPAAKKAAYRVVRPRPLRFDEKVWLLEKCFLRNCHELNCACVQNLSLTDFAVADQDPLAGRLCL